MKRLVLLLTTLLALALSADALACTVTGMAGNEASPLIGYVTKIVTHTTYWTVDFTTSAGTTSSNIDFGSTSGVNWTGSWDSHLTTPIRTWSSAGTGGVGGTSVWINGTAALFCNSGGGGCGLVGSGLSLSGQYAGVTGIIQQSPADASLFVFGWQGGTGGFPTYRHYAVACPNSAGGGNGGGDLVDFQAVFSSPEQSKLWWQQHG